MSEAFYNSMAQTATALIRRFGAAVSVYEPTEARDPVTGQQVGLDTQAAETNGITRTYPQNMIDGARILATDRMIILEPGVEPKVGGRVLVRGEQWSIESVETSAPAGIPLAYFVQARK